MTNEMKPRFPIGLTFQRKRFPKAKELTEYQILNIYTTRNEAGNVVKIEYLVSHNFLGQRMTELMCDTTIARSLTPEQLKEYSA
jgi:hypothetical protein